MAMTIPGFIFDAEPFDLAISALEKQDRWIPVTERLPEKDDFVLVTISGTTSNGKSWEHTMTLAVWTGDSWDLVDADMVDFRIFAWRPLPEPYTPVSHPADPWDGEKPHAEDGFVAKYCEEYGEEKS